MSEHPDMPRITEGETIKKFLERVLRQLRYELESKSRGGTK